MQRINPGLVFAQPSLVAKHYSVVAPSNTGQYRYIEESFEVNELVCAVGVVKMAGYTDPYTNFPVFQLCPVNVQSIPLGSQFDNFRSMVQKSPAVLLSDNTKYATQVSDVFHIS